MGSNITENEGVVGPDLHDDDWYDDGDDWDYEHEWYPDDYVWEEGEEEEIEQ